MRTGPLGIDAWTATSYTEACAAPPHRIQSADSRERTNPDAAERAGGMEDTGRSKLSVAWVPLLASTTSSSAPAARLAPSDACTSPCTPSV